MKLEVNNLSFKYLNSRVIFDQVNFELEKGQILSVLAKRRRKIDIAELYWKSDDTAERDNSAERGSRR